MNVAQKALNDLTANAGANPIFAAAGFSGADVHQLARENPAYAALGAIGPGIVLLPDFKKPAMRWNLEADHLSDQTAEKSEIDLTRQLVQTYNANGPTKGSRFETGWLFDTAQRFGYFGE